MAKEEKPAAETQSDILREQQPKQSEPKSAKQSEPQQAPQSEKQEEAVIKTGLNPYPDYGQLEIDELRSAAQSKGVGIPADVEKAALVAKLRQVGPGPTDSSGEEGPHDIATQGEATGGEVQVTSTGDPYPSYDLLTVEELRGLLPEGEKPFTEDEERGYLIGQLRAVASGPTSAQSAQVGSNRPGESLDVPSGVSDKDRGRG